MTTKSLEELSLKISSGLTPLRSNKEFWANGTVPWLKTEQLGEKYIYDTNEYISEVALQKTSLRIFPRNSISIAMYGEGKTRGNLSILKIAMATNQACCNIDLDPKKADFEYVYYFLKTQYDELRNLSSGVRKNLNAKDIKNYPIRLPTNIDDQRKIASVLKSIDHKISLNNRINKEIEAIAKTLYEYWFLQFDFPDANGKPYKSTGGSMVYNQSLKREIPVGWSAVALKSLFENRTESINLNDIESGTPYSPIDSIPMKKMSFGDYQPSSEAKTSLIKYYVGDILIGAMRVYFHRVCIAPFDGITRATVLVLKPKNSDHTPYLYQVCNEDRTINMASRISIGTQQPYVNWEKSLENYEIPFPSNAKIIDEYSIHIKAIVKEIINREKENTHLSQLRDWLLPMVMNGQVTIKS